MNIVETATFYSFIILFFIVVWEQVNIVETANVEYNLEITVIIHLFIVVFCVSSCLHCCKS